MQLFLTDFQRTGNNITIKDKEMLNQIRKVLRMKIGDNIFIQKKNERFNIKINYRDNETLSGEILKINNGPKELNNIGIAIATSNKRDKMELIVQKLSEIGIKNIYFRPSERSIIKEWNQNKQIRMEKIAKEAIEQSRGRFLPTIKFEEEIGKIILQYENIFIFDKSENQYGKNKIKGNILGVIGPEGGLTENDYKKFGDKKSTISLGETVLRTETASIIAAWILKNL